MTTAEYRVQIDELFNGPLDLLLYLVRRNEVDPLDLPIAEITRQFVEYLEVLEIIDPAFVGDFVVTASALMEIKSRMALPQPEETGDEPEADDDPRSELVQQLLEYKKYKDAATLLEEQAAEWQERYPRLSDDRPGHGRDPSADRIKDVELWDLVSALSRVLRRTEVETEERIRYDDVPIAEHMGRIRQRVDETGQATFSSFFDGTNSRSRIVSIFLAILELLRHHGYRAEQPADYGEIWILPPADKPSQPAAAAE